MDFDAKVPRLVIWDDFMQETDLLQCGYKICNSLLVLLQ
jgi:hypothetical protein